MKKILLSTLAAATLLTTVNADFLGAEVGTAMWSSKTTGDIRKGGATSLDFENDLGYGSKTTNSFIYAYFDHPVPLLPNVKIQNTSLSDSATGTVTKSITFSGTTYSASDKIASNLNLDQTDFIFYYRILDNWVNVDLGLNLKVIDGGIKLNSTAGNVDESFDITLPMLYGKARIDLPFSGFSAEADLSYIGYSGNSITDFKAGAVYQTPFGLGGTIGLRSEKLTLEDVDDVYGNINISGIYAGVFYHF